VLSGGEPVHPDIAITAAIAMKKMIKRPAGLKLSLVTVAMFNLYIKRIDP
jgi:hypothetical protein